MRLIKKIYDKSNPEFLRGIGIGIILSILFVLIFRFDNLLSVLTIVISFLVVLLIGAIVGNYYILNKQKSINKQLDENGENVKEDIKKILNVYQEIRKEKIVTDKIEEQINDPNFGTSVKGSFHLALGLLFRFMTFGTLISVLGGAISMALFIATFMQVERLDNQNKLIEKQNQKIDIQSFLLESQRRASMQGELTHVLDLIRDERKHFDTISTFSYPDEKFELSNSLFSRVNYLSRVFKPYYYVDIKQVENEQKVNDNSIQTPTLISKPISPERGQLLMALINSKVNMSSTRWENVDFSYSDLQSVFFDFPVTLERLNLSNSSFKNSSIVNIDFLYCKLSYVNFSYSHIDNIWIEGSEINNADFSHSKIDKLEISQSILDNVKFEFAFINNSWLVESIVESTDFRNLRIPYSREKTLDSINIDFDDQLFPLYSTEKENIEGKDYLIIKKR